MSWNIYLEKIQKAIVYQELFTANINDINLQKMDKNNEINLINFLNKIGTKITCEKLLLIKYDKQKEEKEQLAQIRSELDILLKNKKFTNDELLSFKTFLETNCYFNSGYHYYFKVNSQVYSLDLQEDALDANSYYPITKVSFDKAIHFEKLQGYKRNKLSMEESSILFSSIKSIIKEETGNKDVYLWNPILEKKENLIIENIDIALDILKDLFESYFERYKLNKKLQNELKKQKQNLEIINDLNEEIKIRNEEIDYMLQSTKVFNNVKIISKKRTTFKEEFKKRIEIIIKKHIKNNQKEIIDFIDIVFEKTLNKNIFDDNKKYNISTFEKAFENIKENATPNIIVNSFRSRLYLKLIKRYFPKMNVFAVEDGILFSENNLKSYNVFKIYNV